MFALPANHSDRKTGSAHPRAHVFLVDVRHLSILIVKAEGTCRIIPSLAQCRSVERASEIPASDMRACRAARPRSRDSRITSALGQSHYGFYTRDTSTLVHSPPHTGRVYTRYRTPSSHASFSSNLLSALVNRARRSSVSGATSIAPIS